MKYRKELIDIAKNKKPDLIIYGLRGSESHGLRIPGSDSDIDAMGIYIDDLDYYFGLPKGYGKGTIEINQGKYDIVLYEIRKMFSLLLAANPNVLSLLWLDSYLHNTEYGRIIIEKRDIFSSKLAHRSFTGYANGQLKRMTVSDKNKRMGEKRKKLVDKFGYDVKSASHLIRLLRMGCEFLSTGELKVFREDREDLLDIKSGKWSIDEIKDESERLFSLSHELKNKSPLPDRPDYQKAEKLLVEILSDRHFNKYITQLNKINIGAANTSRDIMDNIFKKRGVI